MNKDGEHSKVEMEKLRIEQLKVEAETKEKALETEKEIKFTEIKKNIDEKETGINNGH